MKGIIWGLDRSTCFEKLDTIIADYELYWKIKPKRIRRSKLEYEVEFKNDDIWWAIAIKESARGRRCNISLIDERIPHELMPIIKGCTTCPPFNAISYY